MRIGLLFWLLQFFLIVPNPMISTVFLMDSQKQNSFLPAIPFPALPRTSCRNGNGGSGQGPGWCEAAQGSVACTLSLWWSCVHHAWQRMLSPPVSAEHSHNPALVFLRSVSCVLLISILCASQNQAKSFMLIPPVFNSLFIEVCK